MEEWKNKKISGHEVVLKRSIDFQKDIKITIKFYRLGGTKKVLVLVTAKISKINLLALLIQIMAPT